MDELTPGPGAYLLSIECGAPLTLDGPKGTGVVLARGRYGYCGSAYGPGGIRARVARHRRPSKTRRWHVDYLTALGRITAVRAEPGGNECALMDRLRAQPGVSIPAPGFGSSDCRRCPSHLAALPPDFSLADRGGRTE